MQKFFNIGFKSFKKQGWELLCNRDSNRIELGPNFRRKSTFLKGRRLSSEHTRHHMRPL